MVGVAGGPTQTQAEHAKTAIRQLQKLVDLVWIVAQTADVADAQTKRLGRADHPLRRQSGVDSTHDQELHEVQTGTRLAVLECCQPDAVQINDKSKEPRAFRDGPLVTAGSVDLLAQIWLADRNDRIQLQVAACRRALRRCDEPGDGLARNVLVQVVPHGPVVQEPAQVRKAVRLLPEP